MKAFSQDLWQQTADYVLAVLVAEEGLTKEHRHYWKVIERQILALHFPQGQWRSTYLALMDLIISQKAIHISTLQTALAGQVSPEYISLLFALCGKNTTLMDKVFATNLDTLYDFGERAYAIEKLQAGATALTVGDNRGQAAVLSDTISSLMTSGGDTIRHETADSMADDFASFLEDTPSHTMKTGIEVLDMWTSGISAGDFMAIVGAMKQRKTSIALNAIINMARRGHSCALMMFESNKKNTNAAIVAMLAQEYIWQNGLYGKADTNADGTITGNCEQIWVKSLLKLQKHVYKLGQHRAEAIRYGISEFKKLGEHLRIYDRSKDGGSLSDTASAYRLALRDKKLYDTDFIAIDHAQRIGESGKSDYEKLLSIVPFLEVLARRENIAICLLAQLSADKAEGTGDHHASGVRGGTILDEAVDTLITVLYRGKHESGRYPNDIVKLTPHQSRYGDGGAESGVFVAIDPNTGWLPHHGKKLGGIHFDGGNVLYPDMKKGEYHESD